MTVILNAGSGLGDKGAAQRRALEILKSGGGNPRVIELPEGGDAADLAQQALERGERLVAAGGGDGTVSAVAGVLARSEAVLGVLPFGTLNHFARDAGIPPDPEAAARVLLEGKVARVDVGQVNGRIFVNNSSLGLYAKIVRERVAEQRRGRGKWSAFAHASLSVLGRLPLLSVRLDADGRQISVVTPFVFIGNNEYEVQGFDLGARERLDNGCLWLYVAPHRAARCDLLRFAVRALAGRLRQERDFQPRRVRDVWVETRRSAALVALDGEIEPMRSPLHYRVLPGALRVMVPA